MKFLVVLLIVPLLAQQQVEFDVLAIKKCTPNDAWSIHGWWPEYTATKWPQWCDSSRYRDFNNSAISSIKSQLEQYWSSCPGWPPAFSLWKHEYEKHGTCTKKTVLEYFEMALTAFHVAGYNSWYNCCNNARQQCLIPFKPDTTQWLGWCDTSGTHSIRNGMSVVLIDYSGFGRFN